MSILMDSRAPGAPYTRVGLLIESLSDRFWHEVVLAVAGAARRRGIRLFVFVGGTLDSPELAARQSNRCYQLANPEVLDGLIVAPLGSSAGPDRLAEYIKQYRPLPVVALTAVLDAVPSVCTDNIASMRHAVVHLIAAHGLQRIAFIRGPLLNAEAELRYEGYRRALEERGLEMDSSLVLQGDFSEQSGRRVIRELDVASGVPFDGLVAANDSMALGALLELSKAGVRVPEQVKIVSIDDVPEGRWGKPSLSTVRQPLGRLAEEAVANVLAQIEGGDVERLTLIAGALVVRESCGCRSAFEATDEARAVASVAQVAHASLGEALCDALHGLSPGGSEELPDEWRRWLVDALLAELSGQGAGALNEMLDRLLTGAAMAGRELGDWQRVVSALRDTLPAADCARVDEQLFRCRMHIGDVAERQQAALRSGSAAMLQHTIAAGSDVLGSFSEHGMFDGLSRHFPAMMLRCCFVTLYDEDASWPPTGSRLVFGYKNGRRVELPPDGVPFSTHRLLPDDTFPERPASFTVAPLFYGDTPMGVMMFELGPPQGQVYEWLREQVSVALEGSRLLRRIEREVEDRQRAERERLAHELELAARIQLSVLPQRLVVRGLDIAASMVPATEVGGDCYDVLPFDGGCWLSIGDVAGHGLGPGVVMMMLQSSVAAVLKANPHQAPAEALRLVNAVMFDNIKRRLGQDEHATLMLLRYEHDGHIVFAGAHEEPIVYRARTGKLEVIEAPGLWIAIKEDVTGQMPASALALEPDDLLLLYTDGAVEARNSSRAQFGVERLAGALREVHAEPVDRIVEYLLDSVSDWMDLQRDDITLLVARQQATDS